MDTVYCLILEHLLIQEWYNVIGPEGSQYTLVQPLKKSTVPTLYHFIDENIGIVKHLAPKETWLKGSKATKFDALAFITFYASVGYSVLLSEWGLKESDVLWSRYSQKKTRNVTSFTMSRSMDSGEVDECRKHKLDELRHQISKLFKTLQQAKRTVEYTGKPGVFYSFWKNVNTFGSLPFEQRDLFDQLIRVAAYLLLNVLDDPERLRRAQSIARKIPVSFLTTSLYFINPAPFIDKILKLFVWQPSQGVYSFAQRLAGSICGHARSKEKCDAAGVHIDQEKKLRMNKALDKSHCSSVLQLQEYKVILEHAGIEVDDKDVDYAKKYVRFREKQQFLDHLSSDTPSAFLDYLGKMLPHLLNELQKAVSLSTLVSKFFELFNNVLSSFPANSTLSDPTVQKQVVEDVIVHITKFMEFFYTVIHYTSSVHGTKDELPYMTAIFDFIFGWAMRMNVPAYDGTEPALYHEKVKEMVHELNSEEKEALEAYIKQVEGLSAKGLDGRHWPKNDTIENIFLPQLRTVFSKDC